MDVSPEYIKMCEKASEIQPCLDDTDGVGGTWISGNIIRHRAPLNQPHDKDGLYQVTDEMAIRRCESCGNEEEYIKSSRAIWIPSQDQLQEMVYTEEVKKRYSCTKTRWLTTGIDLFCQFNCCDHFTSMEQLWLAFVMKEKYSKQWLTSSQEWVKI